MDPALHGEVLVISGELANLLCVAGVRKSWLSCQQDSKYNRTERLRFCSGIGDELAKSGVDY
jgi:hypothetical protein